MIDQGPGPGPALTTRSDNRLLICRAKASPYTPVLQLKRHWPTGGRVSVRTLINRLHSSYRRARRVVK